MKRSLLAVAGIVGAVFMGLGCSGESPPASDAGAPVDAGPGGADAGALDAGPARDAGAAVDSAVAGDAGAAADAGAPVCADTGGACTMEEQCCPGLHCCPGGKGGPLVMCQAVCPISDRNAKEGFEDVDADEILEGVARLPISRWSYVADPPGVRHVGPMAQDFQETFDVGASDRMIFQIDADGVALASIQALARRTDALRADNERLRRDNLDLRARLDALESRLGARARR